MEKYMNKPTPTKFSEKDILDEYEKYRDIKKLAKIFCLPVKEVKNILKNLL